MKVKSEQSNRDQIFLLCGVIEEPVYSIKPLSLEEWRDGITNLFHVTACSSMKNRVLKCIEVNEVPVLVLSLLTIIGTHASEIYIPETTKGELCVIPFTYKNKIYQDCISDGANEPWCYIDESFTKWDYCSPNLKFKNCKVATPNVTIEEIKEILDEHNAFRSKLPALRMRKLSWNTELAHRAQAAANLCKHDHVEASLCGERDTTGQNLFYTYNENDYPGVLSWKYVIKEWSDEEKYFNFKKNECQYGEICGHFTQVAWDKTHLVGCGKAACFRTKKGKPLHSILYYCNYYQSGNVGGNLPYIESTGKKCEDCHIFDSREKFLCDENNLCETCNKGKLEKCIGIDEIRDLHAKGFICADKVVDCASNQQLCEPFRNGVKLPKPISDYLENCKKTCKMCS